MGSTPIEKKAQEHMVLVHNYYLHHAWLYTHKITITYIHSMFSMVDPPSCGCALPSFDIAIWRVQMKFFGVDGNMRSKHKLNHRRKFEILSASIKHLL